MYQVFGEAWKKEASKLTKRELIEMLANKGIELAKLQAERNAIAKSIHVVLDDGAAPDNLADHVELLMIQEYYPMVKKLEML